MSDLEHRLRTAMHDAVDGAQPPPNLAELVKRRNRPRRAVRARPGHRWPGWVPPLAAAVAVAAVIAGILGISNAFRRPAATTADGAIAYVLFQNSGTVTPIRTATNTALPRIKVEHLPESIAITTPSTSPSNTRR